MYSKSTSIMKSSARHGHVIAVLSLAVLLLFSLQGCGGSTSKTYPVDQATDFAGNTLVGCEDEVFESAGGSIKIITRYKDYTVSGTTTKLSYDEWIQAGRPDNDKGYKYYYVYTPTGEEHALVYLNNKDVCIEVTVHGRNGRRTCALMLNEDGVFLLKNPVTGDTVNREALEQDYQYYHEEASRIVNAIDPDFLYSLDTQSNIPRSAKSSSSKSNSKPGIPSGAIEWTNTSKYLGETVTICGPIVSSTVASSSNGSPTYLDMGAAYPASNRVSIVIWGEDAGNFPQPPVSMYEGKTICVTGEVYSYRGTCSIKVTSPSQIKTIG